MLWVFGKDSAARKMLGHPDVYQVADEDEVRQGAGLDAVQHEINQAHPVAAAAGDQAASSRRGPHEPLQPQGVNIEAPKPTETPEQFLERHFREALEHGFQLERFTYTSADGKPIYWRVHLNAPRTGKKEMAFPMRLTDRGEYTFEEPRFPGGRKPLKPIYALRLLAQKPDARVWWTEDEAEACALIQLGILATTTGSSYRDTAADLRPLAGRSVVIWPKNNARGLAHGERVAEKLRALDCVVDLIDVRTLGLPKGGGVVDWLKAHPNVRALDWVSLPRVRPAPTETTGERESGSTDRRRKNVDWVVLEVEYGCGVLSLRQLAKKHGISAGRICQVAKRAGWIYGSRRHLMRQMADQIRDEALTLEYLAKREKLNAERQNGG